MGRPLNKKLFGDFNLPGKQIKVVDANLGSGIVSNCWIVKQKGTRKFEIATSSESAICTLVNNITGPYQAKIAVFLSGGGTEFARTITKNRVKTWSGSDIVWRFDPPSGDIGQLDNS